MDMSPQPARSGLNLPAGRTGHACAQCRHRKQKCGGLTNDIKCRPCTARRVKCSFQDEVTDLRHNPYLRIRPCQSSTSCTDKSLQDTITASSVPPSLIPALSALERDGPTLPAESGTEPGLASSELSRALQCLTERMTELERRLSSQERDGNPRTARSGNTDAGSSHHTGLSNISISPGRPCTESGAAQPHYPSPPLMTSPGDVMTDGPLKTLNKFQADSPVESEVHDPVSRAILTQGEAYVMFKLFFTHGHPNAPFLDASLDSDLDHVRCSNTLLFLAILSIGARFWGASSRLSCWLHPRYADIVRLLDAEMMRVTLRPRQEDHMLETVQALMLCAHWMPLDVSLDKKRYHSRFSEAGAWHCLGLAIRWATSLALDRNCHLSFFRPEEVTRTDARKFRTMLYLVESDHYLALSARRSSNLNPEPLNTAIPNFLACPFSQPTDMRLASLFQVAYGAHFTNCGPTTIESVEAFDRDVQIVERQFASNQSQSADTMSQHFPFTSLRWYRLSYTCAYLDNIDQDQRKGKALIWAIEWASQILVHLSMPPSSKTANPYISTSQLEPDQEIVNLMSFAIDHYYVVISYASFLLVNSWLRSFVDINLRSDAQESETAIHQDRSTSLLYRLVDLAARTLEAASPPEGHLARRYVPLLRGMADLVLVDNTTQMQDMSAVSGIEAADVNMSELQNSMGEDLWEMWQQAGLEPLNWQMDLAS